MNFRGLLSLALAAGCSGPSPSPETPASTATTVPDTPETPASTAPASPGVSPGSRIPNPEGQTKDGAACDAAGRPMLRAADLTPEVDALVGVALLQSALATPPTQRWTHNIDGAFCSSAADPEACAGKLERFATRFSREEAVEAGTQVKPSRPATETEEFGTVPLARVPLFGPRQHSDIYTARGLVTGGSVTWLGSAADVLAAVGPLDTPSDALLYASMSSLRPSTNEPVMGNADVNCILPDGDDWRLRVQTMVSDGPIQHRSTWWRLGQDGTLTEGESVLGPRINAAIGRMPPGLRWAGTPVDEVACWLAQAAHLEAASVVAFDILHRELLHHGAPASLLALVREAQEDEVRHARRVGAFAAALGADISEVEVEAVPLRSLEDIAIENAQEGLVRETWGAVAGMWQAQNAELPGLRALIEEVAEDEIRHAELSRILHAWLWERLDDDARTRVAAARLGAWQEMRAGILADANPTRDRALGLPTGDTARRMLDVLATELEAPACA